MNDSILKLVNELKASANNGLSIDISEKPDGSVSVVFRQPLAENDLDPPTEIDCFGNKYWKNKKGKFHRDGDLPAVIYVDGNKDYYTGGNLHREGDKPAIEFGNGSKVYYKNGKLHRDGDLPAFEHADGDRKFYKDGKLHREGNKPAIITKDKYEYWIDGKHILTVKHNDGVVEI